MTPNADEDVKQHELSFIVRGMQTGPAALKDSLELLTKLNTLS